jgi:hydroxyacylglutathione hydrolase
MIKNENLLLEQMELGGMGNFVYFIGDKKSKEIAIVDPAWEHQKIINKVVDQGLKVKAILLTHGHYDHSTGAEDLAEHFKVKAYIAEAELGVFTPNGPNMVEVKDGFKLKVGGIEIKFISTPGHTPGSVCFLADNVLLTGDTLFIDACGRYDLPGGSSHSLVHSLHQIIGALPDDTLIYPGHNYGHIPYDSLGKQRVSNHHLECASSCSCRS